MANNSSGARSVLYGKTIDHVLEQNGGLWRMAPWRIRRLTRDELRSVWPATRWRPRATAPCAVARERADEMERRFPKVMRRVGGYNLDEFTDPAQPFNLAKLMVGSEGTLGVLEAKLSLVLPKAKAVLVIEFHELLEALAATPLILRHRPSAVEVMDKFILDHTRQSRRWNDPQGADSGRSGSVAVCRVV